jgi:beta-N-acetylhexosaminidase
LDMKRFCWVTFLALSYLNAFTQDKKTRWVDSVFQTLGKEEKVGQLFLANSSSYYSRDRIQNLVNQAKSRKIGGLIIHRSGPMGYAKLVNLLQAQSQIPLLIVADISKGIPETFDSTMSFYDKTILSAVGNDSLLKRVDWETSTQKKILGIHYNFHPGIDSIADLRVGDVQQIHVNLKAKKGDEEYQAFVDGNDFLIDSKNTDAAIKIISKAIKKDKVLAGQLDRSVKKILSLKYDAGLAIKKKIATNDLFSRRYSLEAQLLKQQLAEGAITVAKNGAELVPIQKLDDRNFASVSVGEEGNNEFTFFLSKYVGFQHFAVKSESDTSELLPRLNDKDVIIIALFPAADSWAKNISRQINKLAKTHQVIVCSFGNPFELRYFQNISTLVASYSDQNGFPKATAEILFGGIEAQGKLPMKISSALPEGIGIRVNRLSRLSYSSPESAGLDSQTLQKIESIANEAITTGATPGCHILVAKDGKVVYEKSFGWLTYEKRIPVSDETIYDLASVTKVSATLQAVMFLQEKGLIDINKKASVYLPELKKSNKEDFIIKDIITHQAGLWPYLPFWLETVKDSTVFKKYYSRTVKEDYPFPVAENLFASKSMKDSLWNWIIKAKVRDKPSRSVFDYRYSDMGFYIMQHLNEKLLGQPQEDFLQSKIYKPLGATTLGYLPLRKFSPNQIAPTEKDTLFRKSLLIGYVHDQGAAMHGGIAGHAGLFSNANDLAKLGQMWLNKGSYGGIQFFKPETIELFTTKQYEDSRRGLGWDKPLLSDASSPTSMYASTKTFGHTGFTGTCIWVDPEFNLVYIFLSNRVHPDMNNTKILNANIRPRIQEVVYQSIFNYCKNHPPSETK